MFQRGGGSASTPVRPAGQRHRDARSSTRPVKKSGGESTWVPRSTASPYGIPYFNRLSQSNVAANMPRLLSNNSRFALEEAVPAPTDVVPGNGITKKTFNVPVVIERNDVLIALRSDSTTNTGDVL